MKYDRYSTLDDMGLVVEHDLRQYQSRAECLCRYLSQNLPDFIQRQRENTFAYMYVPLRRRVNIQIIFKHSQQQPFFCNQASLDQIKNSDFTFYNSETRK